MRKLLILHAAKKCVRAETPINNEKKKITVSGVEEKYFPEHLF